MKTILEVALFMALTPILIVMALIVMTFPGLMGDQDPYAPVR